MTVPLKQEYIKAVRMSFAHTSNGLGAPHERAWSYTAII
ncbi:MAG: hypothetical protein HOG88_10475 [Sulfurimonas sp.]|nr:hypothetical protein [Sulfurimonas sp.]